MIKIINPPLFSAKGELNIGQAITSVCADAVYRYSVLTGEETDYIRYFNTTNKLYSKNYFSHPLIGNLFRALKTKVTRIIKPRKYFHTTNSQKQILDFFKTKFHLLYKDILITGLNLNNTKDSLVF